MTNETCPKCAELESKLAELRTWVKQCQLTTWKDQQELQKHKLFFFNQRAIAVCELCLTIYSDVIKRIDALSPEAE